MLTKKQSPPARYISRLAALPLLAITAMAFTVQVENKRPDEQTTNSAFATFQPRAITDTLPRGEKEIKQVDVDKKAEKVTITYADGTVKQMTKKELQAKGELPAEGKRQNITITNASDKQNKLLLIVNGEEYQKNVDSIDPNTIESINVLKGDAATAAYGEKGRKGVIEIKLKKGKPVLN